MSNKLFLLPALLGAMLLFTPACDKDNCKDVDCGANGTCFEGICECDAGFEGGSCETEWSAKFLGSYLGSDVCDGTTYNLTTPAVVTALSSTKIRIGNFGGFLSIVDADIDTPAAGGSADEFTISFTDPGQRVFSGTGRISGNTITGSYTVTYSDGDTDNCTFTYTK